VNELETIKGIGKTTTETLLKKYKSVKKIKEISEKELTELIGKNRAQLILSHFQEGEGK
jgi:excinuclease ABC subunit C